MAHSLIVYIEYVFHDQPVNRENWDLLSCAPVDLLAPEAIVKPAFRHKVNCLANVDTCRKASVIGTREGQDKLTRHLKGFIHFDLLLLEVGWVNHRVDIEKNVGILLEEQEILLLSCFLKLFSVFFRHTIPQLCFTPMIVIDRIKHQVLIMPTECRELHPYIQPRHIDA
jgi:hypothetical protein